MAAFGAPVTAGDPKGLYPRHRDRLVELPEHGLEITLAI